MPRILDLIAASARFDPTAGPRPARGGMAGEHSTGGVRSSTGVETHLAVVRMPVKPSSAPVSGWQVAREGSRGVLDCGPDLALWKGAPRLGGRETG